ncbi:hypothetical protein DPEC_G00137860 [Dallia pectoralis]|uniref:Uncharacterized protein n=1 Tax=Dallia pectoralis TaxID=75939 RepID=A0ACC2GM22_DALPE|nr:hypothetical protein DPEC_G00137860 [Dallia pectoralis]
MLSHLVAGATVMAYIVSAALPSPDNLTLDAVNTRYILRWNWNHYPTNYSVLFTARYTLSNREGDPSAHREKCVRTTERSCDFSDVLNYSAMYVLTVMAEAGGQRSNWSRLMFVADEDAALGPPSHVELEPGDAMVTVRFREPMTEQNTPMSSLLHSTVYFRLQYWKKNHPGQKHEKEVDTTERTLYPLEPWTEYCLHVNAFNRELNKTSADTQPKCVTTHGNKLSQMLLVSLVLLVLLICVGSWIFWRRRKSLPAKYTFPGSILQKAQDPISLPLFPPGESYTVISMVTAQDEQTRPLQQVEGQDYPEPELNMGFSTQDRVLL